MKKCMKCGRRVYSTMCPNCQSRNISSDLSGDIIDVAETLIISSAINSIFDSSSSDSSSSYSSSSDSSSSSDFGGGDFGGGGSGDSW